MEKIQMQTPIVEISGDEMTRIIWNMVKEELIEPYIDLKSVCFDMGQENLHAAGESVIKDASEAVMRYGVGVKCATLNASRIRTALASAIDAAGYFKTPVSSDGIRPSIAGWRSPVTLARECQQGRIRDFAISCMEYALFEKKDLWLSFREEAYKETFDEVFDSEFKEAFSDAGISYLCLSPAESSARALKSEGGFIWALKGQDADIASGFISGAFSMPAMMTGTLVSASGKYIFEAAHSTGTRLFSAHRNGEETSANSVATILSWTRALRMRGIIDRNDALVMWTSRIEESVNSCISAGFITRDMAPYSQSVNPAILNTSDFIRKVRSYYDGEPVPVRNQEPAAVKPAEASVKPAAAKEDDISAEELYEAFFDERSYKKKREILRQMGGKLTDKMITDFAVSLDVVVEDGSWETRYMSLMNCLNQMCRFETDGLR